MVTSQELLRQYAIFDFDSYQLNLPQSTPTNHETINPRNNCVKNF
jgi:hypothetical protein